MPKERARLRPVYARWEWLDELELRQRNQKLSNREIGENIRKKYDLEKGFDAETVSRNLSRDLPRALVQIQRFLAKHRSLSLQELSLTAHQVQWEALLGGCWRFAGSQLAPDYQLGRDNEIVKNEIGSSALIQALEEVALGVSWSAAADAYGFTPGFLRSLRDEPYFHYGLVKLPVQVLDELERQGRTLGKRVPSRDPESAWVLGKHPPSLSEDLVKRLPKTRAWNFQVLTGKIVLAYQLRVHEELSFQQIGQRLQIPWQSVRDLVQNPNCVKVVGQDLWRAAGAVKAWRMIKVGKQHRLQVLVAVSRRKDTAEAIAGATRIDSSTVTHILRELKTDGELSRARDPTRRFHYKITDKGRSHLESIARKGNALELVASAA
jgi:predicted transcriptional regulator